MNKNKKGLFNFIKRFFKKDKEKINETDDIIYTVPKETKKEKHENSSLDGGPIYMVPEEKPKKQKPYENIIEYAKTIRNDKENHKRLQSRYIEALKENNKDLVTKTKNLLWESQSNISLEESFLRNKIKEIQKSSLNSEEKTKLINYLCGVAKIKIKEKPKHMKEENDETIKNPEDELNSQKEKILSSKHFTNIQKKNMIREIDEELIELAKQKEKDTKSL